MRCAAYRYIYICALLQIDVWVPTILLLLLLLLFIVVDDRLVRRPTGMASVRNIFPKSIRRPMKFETRRPEGRAKLAAAPATVL